MSHFGDPGFVYHVAAAQLWGTVAMRLADAAGLPLDYRDYAWQVREFFDQCMKIARRRKLAAALDEKPMNKALQSFSDDAERVEKARKTNVVESEHKRVEQNYRHHRAVQRYQIIHDSI